MLYTSHDNQGLIKVLQFLKAHHLEHLSGEDLSEVLKISRVAIWKHIKKIQKLGYKIDSKQNLGYRLVDNTDLLLPWEVTDGLKTRILGKKIYYFDSVDSTQNFASSIAKNKNENGSVVIAETQTVGRGRLDRVWVSPKGGIWMSVILKPRFDVSKITLIPFVVAIALSDTIKKTLKLKTELKWPNDVMLNGKKVAGIVIDASIESTEIENIVIGIGINFKINPKEVESKLKTKENFSGATTLVKKTDNVRPVKLVQSFLEEFERILELLDDNKTQAIITRWTKRSSTIGKHVLIHTLEKDVNGIAIKIDRDGSLIIKQDSNLIKVAVGDVSYKK